MYILYLAVFRESVFFHWRCCKGQLISHCEGASSSATPLQYYCGLSRPSSVVFHLPLCACSPSGILRQFHQMASPPASSWQYIASMARSRWAQTLKLPTQTATCSTFVEMPSNPPAPFPRLMYVVLRIGRLALSPRRLSDDIHVHPSIGRSSPPLECSQHSSDARSCSGRGSCSRPQRSRASSPQG